MVGIDHLRQTLVKVVGTIAINQTIDRELEEINLFVLSSLPFILEA